MSEASPPGGHAGRVDRWIGWLVVLWAIVAASTPATNTDVWLHLASGRAVADGQFRLGTGEGVNHAWLTQWSMFQLYQWAGPTGLMAVKAGLIGLLAWVVLFRLTNGPNWVNSVLVAVGVLAMTQRILLQPATLSLLLMAILLASLQRGGRWAPAIVALWANLDAWFVLGPVMVGGWFVGGLSRSTELPRLPRWIFPATLVSCLATPFHVNGLTLPTELSPRVWASAFADDPRFGGFFASPWRAEHHGPAFWAFLVVLFASALSFIVRPTSIVRWGLLWLLFAVLACWQVRLIPLFAVIGVVIAAQNLQHLSLFLTRSGRVIGTIFVVGFAGLAWTGRVDGPGKLGIAWTIPIDPSLEQAARTVRDWRRDGTLSETDSVWISHPDATHYMMWATGKLERGFDVRFENSLELAGSHIALARDLGLIPGEPGEIAERIGGAKFLLVYDPSTRRTASALSKSLAPGGSRTCVQVVGNVVFMAPQSNWSGPRCDFERQAFAASEEPFPGSGPDHVSESRAWWSAPPMMARSIDADAAGLLARVIPGGATPPSPSLSILAVRHGRLGTLRSPTDGDGWQSLGRAYLTLSRGTTEASAGGAFPLLQTIRRAQITAAFLQAVLRDPASISAHEALANLYAEAGANDLALRHRRAVLRLVRSAGRQPGEPLEQFAEREKAELERFTAIEKLVQDGQSRFVIRTDRMGGDPLARAQIASNLGLHGKAIEVLTSSHADLYGSEGLQLLLDLLLVAGQPADVRSLLRRDEVRRNPNGLGTYRVSGDGGTRPWSYVLPAFDWYDLCSACALGNYADAEDAANRIQERLEQESVALASPLARALMLQVSSETLLGISTGLSLPQTFAAVERARLSETIDHVRFMAVTRGDLATLIAILNIEQGNAAIASSLLQRAGTIYDASKSAAIRPGLAVAAEYTRLINSVSARREK